MKQIQGSGSGSISEQNGSETLIIILQLSLFMYDIACLCFNIAKDKPIHLIIGIGHDRPFQRFKILC